MKSLASFLFLAALAGATLWLLYPHARSQTASETPVVAPNAREIPDGWKEYRNSTYLFSVLIPEALAVRAFEEGAGAASITFEHAADGKGFQVFIVPYSGNTVSAERFRSDVPSGVRRDPRDITVDGKTASLFYSTNPALGDTAEIWFISGGFLYEVTTLAPLDAWLLEIMQTWEFL